MAVGWAKRRTRKSALRGGFGDHQEAFSDGAGFEEGGRARPRKMVCATLLECHASEARDECLEFVVRRIHVAAQTETMLQPSTAS
jgi:hypothetical protein